jgi:hypothetical protein
MFISILLSRDRGLTDGEGHFSEKRRSKMRKLIPTKWLLAVALLVLIAGPAAIAQTGATKPGGSPSTSLGNVWPAPVGHRQPRVDEVPPEKNLGNPNDPLNREDAALDRKIKSICRGC